MQNLSILQLLKTLSTVNALSTSAKPEENTHANVEETKEPRASSTPPSAEMKSGEKSAQTESNPPTHVRTEEEKAAFAYENFLSRHEQIVKRVKNKADRE